MENTGGTVPYLNRDLSWLDFNGRVLEEGLRSDLPPLDRFRFLSIVSSNLDEFFMVRVAAVKRFINSGGSGLRPQAVSSAGGDPSGLSPEKQLALISEKVRSILGRQYRCLKEEVFPALAQGGLVLVRPESYSISQMDYLESFFMAEIYPILTPLRIEQEGGELPVESLSIHAVFLLSKEGEDEGDRISIIQIPKALDRIIRLPPEEGAAAPWSLLEDVALTWGPYLFPGFRVKESMLFKINRDADFSVDEQRDEDFIEAMEEVIAGREHSRAVRMVYSAGSGVLRDELARRLGLGEEDLYEAEGPLDLRTLADLAGIRGFDQLRLKPRKIYRSPAFTDEESLWDRISRGDVMLELPYESFDPVIRFFQDAASDPGVIAIKTALYRTSGDSPVVKALEQAALNGKHVTAVVELKARFDEERNIIWANRLERAGVIVVYGIARLKIHGKISLVIRREDEGLKQYIHLSTGNYNDKTARLYGDFSLFTARKDMALDASVFFNMVTGYSAIQSMRRLVIAPTVLKRRLIELIDREARRSSQAYPGRIMAKMNALADTDMIDALYRASRAGVQVLLNIRGICMLKPGVPGLSENIRVVSILGRFLEHGRIFYFNNGGAEEFYLSSADWMPRNLERRVELMFPALQEDIRERLRDVLEACFRDNRQSWELDSEGRWTRMQPGTAPESFSMQDYLLSKAAEAAGSAWTVKQEFVVRRSPANG
ncbi:MAG: polyphosphate kinase 1 [Treponema sp.]|jgi:polyphosphate kinase|nr:polyphosphate kinase 1 [Treponema sp.]